MDATDPSDHLYVEVHLRSPNRKHERSSFFKYMTVDTGIAVLKNRTLRWSSPILFNDPFDVPRELILGISYEDILRASTQYLSELIQNPPEDTFELSPKVQFIVDTVKAGVSPDVKKLMLDGLKNPEPSGPNTGEAAEALSQVWRTMIPDLRILCLTENPSHAAMWCHYAGNYSGVVLEFNCVDEIDSALLTAERVTYPTTKPPIYTAQWWGELMVLNQETAVQRVLDIATHTKAPDWSYENEWRVVGYRRPNDTGHFTDYPFQSEELAAIYLGPLISESNQSTLISLMSGYSHAKAFKVSVGVSREFAINEI